MNNIPTVEEAIKLIGRTTYSRTVCVTDAVMQQVSRQPILVSNKHHIWQRWTVAASVALLLGVGSALFFSSSPSDSHINAILFDIYDYDNCDDVNICDEMAMASLLFE